MTTSESVYRSPTMSEIVNDEEEDLEISTVGVTVDRVSTAKFLVCHW